ncbi:MAG: DNA-binding transcriptional regulator [Gammaproteobacteria bacterium]|nr:helix-turn-helix domain-containing protein [Gammaproteobacteria bacterium]NNC97202.1 DNA-binding transcriptional regulator [Gammaproteobacteria bacterium]NNM14488.1 DNA-binding transcriptional regulator [Gammaproteobacteria bacterium]
MKNHSDIEAKRQRKATKSMCDAFLIMQERKEIMSLLNDLCTPAELEAITDRWWVLQLLQEKMPYRQISERTGVSVTTIGRVARYWREGAGGYRLALSRLQSKTT